MIFLFTVPLFISIILVYRFLIICLIPTIRYTFDSILQFIKNFLNKIVLIFATILSSNHNNNNAVIFIKQALLLFEGIQESVVSGHYPASNSRSRTQRRASLQMTSSLNCTSDKFNAVFLGRCSQKELPEVSKHYYCTRSVFCFRINGWFCCLMKLSSVRAARVFALMHG